MGRVYKVRRPFAEEIMALKLLCPHPHLAGLMSDEEIRRRFATEARLMQALDHPNIVGILDSGEHEGMPFIIMEYYCRNLGQVIGETYRLENPSRILRIDKAVRFAVETLRGLSCLHRNGIVHRDIKPFNLLLTEDETVRITDFGLSKLRGEIFAGPRQLAVGSPYYCAPEQEKDPNEVDPRADLYSVGVILYRLLTGRLPMKKPDSPSSQNAELDCAWDAFLMRVLDLDRERRPSSADAMIGWLEELRLQWEERMEKVCIQREIAEWAMKKADIQNHALRKTPVKVAPVDATALFGVDEFWRPKRFVSNDFMDLGYGSVRDKATGLVWHKAGSPHMMPWIEAHKYVADLNSERFAGKARWRLPTVDELMSLLTPVPHQDDYCIESLFGRYCKWLWSADRRSFAAAWFVSVHLGYVSWHDFTCRCFVRAVCSE